MKKLAALPLSVSGVFLMSRAVRAEEISLGVYPPVIRIKSKPETEVSVPITVLNNSEMSLNLDLFLEPFYDSGEFDGSISYYSEKDTPKRDFDFIKNIKIKDLDKEINSISLFPKEYKTLDLIFKTPKDMRSDYYFSVIFLKSVNKETTEETISYIKPGGAINILISNNKVNTSVLINDFKTDPFILSGPSRVSLNLKNTSDHYTILSGEIKLYNQFGKEVDTAKLEPKITLSNAERKMIEVNSDNDITLGEKFMLGAYTVKAEVKTSEGKYTTKDIHFIAIPIFVLILLIAIFFISLSISMKVVGKVNLKE
jgi:hypothetical protein